ncbi:MAG: hypothetical protein A3G32_04130 [Deltaproteobacteria bacterium RIFCSPLOWO2_12_FULL_40_28]|nr:MAG: hypothetical protein A3C45_08240 [Deltaproteobacteria bacterium RIFCSPHIGHO2_02_FULL_40_28]OGQ19559.1 MAG: hypothetical protein A3E27_07435 [Deltaproteobacteria bacterium RIFCSPHIGHO2_12_FULL_40_32]OGQ40836.1 MAG: hypothetical protein A3I69_02850 [Deltaproteobacteria bacterium RIFCSPLOWO2_02_FULL_40_36]OGQ53951.1 MAG: hypothetical protein A3G32_04130 [Deltaproteobacteria bacterium RIFCSPLOWO2_12_FULL_40_28]
MKKQYNLTILKQDFTIKSDADEKHVKKVSDYVNKKMHELVSGNKATSSLNVAILAALNIADDFYKLKIQHNDMIEKWSGQLDDLIGKMEKLGS